MFGRSFVQNVKSFNVGWHLPVSPTRHIEWFFFVGEQKTVSLKQTKRGCGCIRKILQRCDYQQECYNCQVCACTICAHLYLFAHQRWIAAKASYLPTKCDPEKWPTFVGHFSAGEFGAPRGSFFSWDACGSCETRIAWVTFCYLSGWRRLQLH